jgi:uncharacterized protein (TIGR04141 family)
LATASDEQELGQISIYLVKRDITFQDAVDWDKVLTKLHFADHEFEVDGVPCRFVYFETSAPKGNPPWLNFVNERLGAAQQHAFSSVSQSPNGLLAIEIEDRLVLASFGRSASAMANRKSLEPDFGIRTAMNMCGNEEIRQTRTQSHSLTPTHIDRQVGQPSGTFVFGLSEAEDLKFISAHIKGDPLVTLQGRDHLTVKVLGAEKLNWDRLIQRCQKFLLAYVKDDYASLFPNYRNFKPAEPTDIAVLDQVLIDTLAAENLDEVQLWIPEFIPNDEFSFTYTDYDKRENVIYSFLETHQLATVLDLPSITIEKLQDKRVYAYSHADDAVKSSKWWSIYDCLIMEQTLDKKHYILTDGEWRRVDDDFYDSVSNFVLNDVREEPSEALYTNISIFDSATGKNTEGVFNTEACIKRKQSIRFDRAKLRIGDSRKDKEFCDILDLTDDGVMRIINCKPYKGSSSVSYLFAQTRFYCESFVRDQVFLDAIREFVNNSECPTKAAYLGHIQSEVKDVTGSDYRVCVWLLCDRKKPLPSKANLPFMAQYELKLMHDHLQQACKFQHIILRFIPVEITPFSKKASPKKKAA